MDNDMFVNLLKKAKYEKDMNAIYKILKEYEGLIVKYSIVNGKFDEDCKAIIEAKIIQNIQKFKKI